jgi:16S rRNA (cytosine967-C5)-methyltransferase
MQHRKQPPPAATAQHAPTALWQQLLGVATALRAVNAGKSGTAALESIQESLRPGVQALLFQVLRNLGRAQALRSVLAPRHPPAAADALLCSALALCWHDEGSPYTPFTLVNQAVEAAKRSSATKAQAAFINGCLRRFLRERTALVAATDKDMQAYWNHPTWWIKRIQQEYPDQWQEMLEANNTHPPLTLRINKKRCSVTKYIGALSKQGLDAHAVDAHGVQMVQACPVPALPGYHEGWFSVQDSAAQQAAPLLLTGMDLSRPLRVLDACAAPGGKTAHLLELANADLVEVTSMELDPHRSQRIHTTLDRLGLKARVVVADAAQPASWTFQGADLAHWDAILLDAPCTASGIVRRHPDIRWLRRESDIEQLAALQARLLAALWPLVKVGGRLLYCTCSVFKAEGHGQVQSFLAHNSDARLLPSPGHLIPQTRDKLEALPENGKGDHDGFFYALLEKAPS